MRPILLIDFGSTYTKLTAVDPAGRRILGTAQGFTTASSDIELGLSRALSALEAKTGPLDYEARLACSSAAGGLRMIACGLVPALTAKAARFAAYGAGAKVIKTYSYELTPEDALEIAASKPDILLLVGGTDGGNSAVVRHNAQVIAGIPGDFPVVYAGNRAAKEACVAAIAPSSHAVHAAPNVMPSFGVIQVEPVQAVIREIFLSNIIRFKGLSRTQQLLNGILMPTPAAVLRALSLLSQGRPGRAGIGELLAVDLGGATTDVYSIASGLPTRASTFVHGLAEPYVKRTVEGDIGMRYSARGVAEEAGTEELARVSGLDQDQVQRALRRIEEDPGLLPDDEAQRALDFALATFAIRFGLTRHAGSLQEVYTPVGPMYQQIGKDLSEVRHLLLTGGALIHTERAEDIVALALDIRDPGVLTPRSVSISRDMRYILSAMGLLAGLDEAAALDILLQDFGKDGAYAAC